MDQVVHPLRRAADVEAQRAVLLLHLVDPCAGFQACLEALLNQLSPPRQHTPLDLFQRPRLAQNCRRNPATETQEPDVRAGLVPVPEKRVHTSPRPTIAAISSMADCASSRARLIRASLAVFSSNCPAQRSPSSEMLRELSRLRRLLSCRFACVA